MSCELCEEIQQAPVGGRYFIRIGTADVELVGCTVHVSEAMCLIRQSLREAEMIC